MHPRTLSWPLALVADRPSSTPASVDSKNCGKYRVNPSPRPQWRACLRPGPSHGRPGRRRLVPGLVGLRWRCPERNMGKSSAIGGRRPTTPASQPASPGAQLHMQRCSDLAVDLQTRPGRGAVMVRAGCTVSLSTGACAKSDLCKPNTKNMSCSSSLLALGLGFVRFFSS
jgi:hypothetical protein